MLDVAPVSTPMNFSTKVSSQGDPVDDLAAFKRLIGRLIYHTNTCPDITYAVHRLSQHVASPTKLHHQVAFRILRYIKQTPGQGIFLKAINTLTLKAYSDLDWASCPDSRKSTTGYIVYLGDSPISWRSKKQSTVSRSSSEAEYRALAQTACEIHWLINLLTDLRLPFSQPATIFYDNHSAIKIAINQVFHERTKHIEIDCHLIREKVQRGTIKLLPIHTTLQLADILTKTLSPSTFHTINSKLGTLNIYAKLEGGCQKTIKSTTSDSAYN
ncbi:uncharacterized protein LOC106766352 [Vigna radiata var. radiata]|uniref:Uncharacterized protein LOC106766352 n=1 Tax=Vigna radiata var. radiata TaxID=3916 RepID=A0A1S3UKL4_VIGRR|nr:uncharacterized protein LOC106766352 [Vigna radiata var. radiata]